MTTRSTKKSLMLSCLALLLCFSMLIGTTFAWFTDEVTSKGNIIKSGTLDIEMLYADGDEALDSAKWQDASKGAIFNSKLWEPGYTDAKHINIKNNGTLALKYQLLIEPTGEVSDLANVIDVYFIEGGKQLTRDALDTYAPQGTLADLIKGGIAFGSLTAGQNRIFTIVLKMQETAGNEYQDKSIGSDFAIKLLATQLTSEEDSFGPDYDKDAWHPEMEVYSANDLQSAINNGETNIVLMADIESAETLSIPEGATVTLNLNDKAIAGNMHKNDGSVIKNEGNLVLKNGTISSTANNGGSAILNKGNAILDNVTLNGAPNADGSWPSYTVNNTGVMTVENVEITSYHGAVASYGTGAVVTLNDCEIDMAGIPGFTSHGIYTYNSGAVIVNGGVYANKATDQNATGASVINGAVTVNGGTFTGRIENYYGTPVIKGGTFSVNPKANFIAEGFKTVANADGTYSVIFPQESFDNLIDNAQPGDTVNVPAGEYTFPASKLEAGMTLNCAPGTVFEGKSAMNVNGATVIGATFSNPDSVAGAGTINGTFKDCVFEGSEALRWCYAGETVVFENCEFKTDFRGVHFDGMDHDVIFRNCKINGFNAFGGTATVTFEGCTFGCDESRYNGLNMYCNTVLKDCKFEFVSGKTNFIDFEEAGHNLTITNCTATLDGKAANVLDFVGGTYKKQTNITVDGAPLVFSGADLNAAIAGGAEKILLAEGNYTMPSSGNSNALVITGTKDTVVDVTLGAYMENANVTFEGVTIKTGTGKVNGNGSDYAAFYSKDVTYKNCTFEGPMRVGRDGAKFIECTFNNLGNDYVWTYGNDVTFERCTFNTDGKAILVYSDGGNEVAKVTVKDCTFNSTQGAKAGAIANQNCAAIEIHNYGNGVDLVTEGNTYDANFSGEWRIKTYENGRTKVFVNGTEYTTIAIDGKIMTIDADKNVTVQ